MSGRAGQYERYLLREVRADRDWWQRHAIGAGDAFFDMHNAVFAGWVASAVFLCATLVLLLPHSPLLALVLGIVGLILNEALARWLRRIRKRFKASMDDCATPPVPASVETA